MHMKTDAFFAMASLTLWKYIGKDSVHKDLGFLKYMHQGNIITGTLVISSALSAAFQIIC